MFLRYTGTSGPSGGSILHTIAGTTVVPFVFGAQVNVAISPSITVVFVGGGSKTITAAISKQIKIKKV